MPSRRIEDLDPRIRGDAVKLRASCIAIHLPVTIVGTLRTLEEQKKYLALGTSWTLDSKHLPQPPNGLSLAFDIVPTVLLTVKGWGPDSPLWNELGLLGKSLGLSWGGDWQEHPDKAHFEYKG
jgi:hypothetical protein